MAFTTMWIYPWDLHDEGTERVLELLSKEVGLDAVSLAVSYHSFTALRPHLAGRKWLVGEGASYFKPQLELYDRTPIKPLVSPLVSEEDVLRNVSNYCQSHDLSLVAWTVATHNSSLGRKYIDFTQQSAFGDPYSFILCPSNPAVREYAKALCKDLSTNYHLEALELEHLHFGSFQHYHRHPKVGVKLGPVEDLLLSLCFCDSCLQAAQREGVDTQALVKRVQGRLERSFRGENLGQEEESKEKLLTEEAELAPYLKVRERKVTSLLEEIREEVDCRIHLLPLGDRRTTGSNLRELDALTDTLEILCYTPKPESVRQRVQLLHQESGIVPGKIQVGLGAYYPASPSLEALEANVREGQRLGVWGYAFYNYGMMPWGMLPWLKEAVKIAKSRA